MKVEVGQTWVFKSRMHLVLVVKLRVDPEASVVDLLNLETGEVYEEYPLQFFHDQDIPWTRVS